MRGKRRKEAKTSNLILLAMGLFALTFIAAMTAIFCVKGAVPATLIQYTCFRKEFRRRGGYL